MDGGEQSGLRSFGHPQQANAAYSGGFEQIDGGSTRVRYDWRVKTTKPWMNLLAPVARPFFKWNHDVIMGWGEEGLRKRLKEI